MFTKFFTKNVEIILLRAMKEADFAKLIISNPELALHGYELTKEEANLIMDMSLSRQEVLLETFPEERRSFGVMNHNEGILQCR